MHYLEFKEKLQEFPVFSVSDIRKIEPNFGGRRLNEWQKKGYIKKIRRSFYMFADMELNEDALFFIANKIYSPSYVSCESALSFYGLIPEGVYSVTSLSTKKTEKWKTPISEFTYRHIKPELFFGYRLAEFRGQKYKIAEKEKAVLDYLYLNPHLSTDADFFEWRFNGEDFLAQADMKKFSEYLMIFGNKRMEKCAEALFDFIKKKK
jgi:predicted transcriptional regulator of viral defense system